MLFRDTEINMTVTRGKTENIGLRHAAGWMWWWKLVQFLLSGFRFLREIATDSSVEREDWGGRCWWIREERVWNNYLGNWWGGALCSTNKTFVCLLFVFKILFSQYDWVCQLTGIKRNNLHLTFSLLLKLPKMALSPPAHTVWLKFTFTSKIFNQKKLYTNGCIIAFHI